MAFSDVFTGNKGLVKSLAKALGGTATIVYQTKGEYDAENDLYQTETTEVSVGWFPNPQVNGLGASYVPSRGGFGMAGGLMTESHDIAGTIPYADIQGYRAILPNQDLLIVDGQTYTIKKATFQRVQNAITAVFIEADR